MKKTYTSYGMEVPRYKNPIKVIKQFCSHCMGWQPSLVEGCTAPECPLFPWRRGKNPYRKPKTDKAIAQAKSQLVRLNLRKKHGSLPQEKTNER